MFTVPVAIVSVGTVLLILKIRRQRRSNAAMAPTATTASASADPSEHERSGNSAMRNRELKRAETALLVDALYLFSWCLGMTVMTVWIASAFSNLNQANWAV